MGVDLNVYRVRIGTFTMPNKCRRTLHGYKIGYLTVRKGLRLCVLFGLLLVICGDVEVNPGPATGRGSVQRSQGRQTQLSFSQAAVASPPTSEPRTRQQRQQQNRFPDPNTPPFNSTGSTNSADVLAYLQDMRSEFRTDLSSLNNKIDDISLTINNLKAENESLKEENKRLWAEIDGMKKKTDRIEGHTRRNNLRINGIDGTLNESWSETERKVREFVTDDLNMPEMGDVDIERAHRMQSQNPNKCTIIVKFSRFKDKDSILNRAKQVLNRESTKRVHEDFTDRVKTHRRELGKRLVQARNNGQYASLSFDKLIIENTVYGYDDNTKDTYIIGQARGNPGTRFHQSRRQVNRTRFEQQDDGRENEVLD